MTASAGFAEFLREQCAPLGPITVKRMFGSTGVFCDGVMLALVQADRLYFRIDDQTRAAFAEAEAHPFTYTKQGETIALAFWQAPDRLLDEPDEFVRWARLALAAARRVAAARPQRRRR